jgi:hypothetical protein
MRPKDGCSDIDRSLRHLATDPPGRLTPICLPPTGRAISTPATGELRRAFAGGKQSGTLKQSIPGTEEHDIAILLGDGVIYTADATALRGTSPFIYDKLAYMEKDRAGPAELCERGACFALPAAGKPILRRIPKAEITEYLNMRRRPESLGAKSGLSSDSTTIKEEPGLSSRCGLLLAETANIVFDDVSKDAHHASAGSAHYSRQLWSRSQGC